jgi:hypothetical protein
MPLLEKLVRASFASGILLVFMKFKGDSMCPKFSKALILGLVFSAQALAASPAKKNQPAVLPVAPAAQVPQAKQALGPIANYATEHGIRQCLGRIDQISNFLTNDAASGAAVFLSPQESDRGLVSVSMEVLGSNGLSYVNTAYAPTARGCDGVYEAVTYWSGTCEQVAATFQGFSRAKPLRQHIQTLDGGPTAKIYLMPAGQGCISIKKEVVY